eukprot:5622030-Pleurochrysis_carterae.AAC.1
MLKGSGAGGALTRPRGGFDAGARWGDVGHARTGARKPGAERERYASTQVMPMEKYETVHASDEMKSQRRRLRQSYVARDKKGNKRVSGSKR